MKEVEMRKIHNLKEELLQHEGGPAEQSVRASDYVKTLNAAASGIIKSKGDIDQAARLLNEAEFITRREEEYFPGSSGELLREEYRAATYASLACLSRHNGSCDDAVLYLLETASLEGEPSPHTNLSLAMLLIDMQRYDAAITCAGQAVREMSIRHKVATTRGEVLPRSEQSLLAASYHILGKAQLQSSVSDRREESHSTLSCGLMHAKSLGIQSETYIEISNTIKHCVNPRRDSTDQSSHIFPLEATPQKRRFTPPARETQKWGDSSLPQLPRNGSGSGDSGKFFYKRNVVDILPALPQQPQPPHDKFNATAPARMSVHRTSLSKKALPSPKLGATYPSCIPPADPSSGNFVRKKICNTFSHLDFGTDPTVVAARLCNASNENEFINLVAGITFFGSSQIKHTLNGNDTVHTTWRSFSGLKATHLLIACDERKELWVAAQSKNAPIRKNGLKIETVADNMVIGDRLLLGSKNVACVVRSPLPALIPRKPSVAPLSNAVARPISGGSQRKVSLPRQSPIITDSYTSTPEWEKLNHSNIRQYIDFLQREVEIEEAALASPCSKAYIYPTPPPVSPPSRPRVLQQNEPDDYQREQPSEEGLRSALELCAEGCMWTTGLVRFEKEREPHDSDAESNVSTDTDDLFPSLSKCHKVSQTDNSKTCIWLAGVIKLDYDIDSLASEISQEDNTLPFLNVVLQQGTESSLVWLRGVVNLVPDLFLGDDDTASYSSDSCSTTELDERVLVNDSFPALQCTARGHELDLMWLAGVSNYKKYPLVTSHDNHKVPALTMLMSLGSFDQLEWIHRLCHIINDDDDDDDDDTDSSSDESNFSFCGVEQNHQIPNKFSALKCAVGSDIKSLIWLSGVARYEYYPLPQPISDDESCSSEYSFCSTLNDHEIPEKFPALKCTAGGMTSSLMWLTGVTRYEKYPTPPIVKSVINNPEPTSNLVMNDRSDRFSYSKLVFLLDCVDRSEVKSLSLLYDIHDGIFDEENLNESAATVQRCFRCYAARKHYRQRYFFRHLSDEDREEAAAFIQFHVRSFRLIRSAKKELAMRKTLIQNYLSSVFD